MHFGRAAGGRDRVDRLVQLLGTAGDAGDLGARRRQPQGDRLANAARRAGDERRLAGEINLNPPIRFVCHVRDSQIWNSPRRTQRHGEEDRIASCEMNNCAIPKFAILSIFNSQSVNFFSVLSVSPW